MKKITMLAMAIIIAGMFHANAAKGEEANGIKVEKLWEVNAAPNANLYGVQFSPMDKYIIVAGGQAYYVMDAKDGKKIHGINNNSIWEDGKNIRPANNPRFIYNDTILLLENENKTTIDFHTFPDMRIIGSLQSTAGQIVTYDVSKDQKLLVADVDGQKIVLWDLETKKIIREKRIEKFAGEKESWLSLPVFVPNHQHITVNTFHTYVTGHQPKPPHEQTKTISMKNVLNYSLDSISHWDEYLGEARYCYSLNGKYFAKMYTGTIDGLNQCIIDIIEYDTKKIIQTIHTGYLGTVGNYFITPDNKYLILVAGTTAVYSIKTGKQVFNFHYGTCMGGMINSKGNEVAFSLNKNLYKFSFNEISSVHRSINSNNTLSTENPIVKDTNINLIINEASKIILTLVSADGKEIELYNGFFEIGKYELPMKLNELPNGHYFIKLIDDTGCTVNKIIIER